MNTMRLIIRGPSVYTSLQSGIQHLGGLDHFQLHVAMV